MYTKILSCFLLFVFTTVNAYSQQTTLDVTDSLVNHQKQFIIRFDVASGNVYVPVKKSVKDTRKEKDRYKMLPFEQKKDTIIINKNKYEKIIQRFGKDGEKLIPDTIYATELVKKIGPLRYIKAGRFFRPKVGSFIRLIFENVPKGMDVHVSAEFLDKNLENASTFEGYLNANNSVTDTAVSPETKKRIDNEKDKITNAAKEIENRKSELEIAYKNLNDKGELLKGTADRIESDLKKIKPKKNAKDGPILAKIDEFADEINATIENIRKIPLTSNSDSLTLKEKLDNIQIACKKIKDNNGYNVDTVKVLKKYIKNLNQQIDSIVIEKNKIDTLDKKLNKYKIEMDSVIIRTYLLVAAIYDSIYSRRTIYIQPIQVANNDITLLKITYQRDDKAQNDINREIMLKNKFGFKLDFSTGFIGTGLKDDNYRLEPTVNDGTKIIEDPKGDFAVGFGILAHAYFRTGERINVALNTGLMLNSSNQTVNYLAGLSLPLGLEQRFVISSGFSFGKVKRLASGYEIGKEYPSTSLSIASGVPYTEKWKNSWYLGVSYNLSTLTASSRKTVVAR